MLQEGAVGGRRVGRESFARRRVHSRRGEWKVLQDVG